MRRCRFATTALLAATLLGQTAACRKPEVVELGGPVRAYRSKDYPDVLERWTRKGQVLRELDTALSVHATFESSDFRSAYSERYVDAFRLPPAEADRVRAINLSEAQASNEFYLAVTSTDASWNELEKKTSVWRVALLDDYYGVELTPTLVRAERRPDPRERIFFPYVTVFSRTYKVKFPVQRVDGTPFLGRATRNIILRFAGPLGQLNLRWEVRPR